MSTYLFKQFCLPLFIIIIFFEVVEKTIMATSHTNVKLVGITKL